MAANKLLVDHFQFGFVEMATLAFEAVLIENKLGIKWLRISKIKTEFRQEKLGIIGVL